MKRDAQFPLLDLHPLASLRNAGDALCRQHGGQLSGDGMGGQLSGDGMQAVI